MTQSPKKRVRKKPEGLFLDTGDWQEMIYVEAYTLKNWKKFHKWIGKTIKYLEHKGE